MVALQKMANKETDTLVVDTGDLKKWVDKQVRDKGKGWGMGGVL